ncbi:MAG: glycosyltransferase family 1 protein, partial [Pyrinomonadaceae bacterium]
MLGELTVSMLKGEAGFQHKEISKLLDWLTQEGSPDVISLPYTLLLGLARPLKEALGRPICCTLQGEDLFLEGLQEPYRSESKDLIRANTEYVDAFIAVS